MAYVQRICAQAHMQSDGQPSRIMLWRSENADTKQGEPEPPVPDHQLLQLIDNTRSMLHTH
jgi:hypothetical protein